MPIRKKKISDLTLADSLKGLYTIGYKVVGGVKTSVKVGLEYIQVAYEDVVKATQDAISAAKTALTAASTADTSREAIEANELERESNESARKTSEQERAAAENQRATAETGRDNAEKARVTEFSKIKTDAEKATGDAISATGKTNEATQNANVATNAANAATAAANQAAIEANKSAENANEEAIAAQVAAALAEKVAKHPPYVGKDHYFYVFDLATDTYNKTDIYTKGDAFSVSITYPSVAALEADVDNPEIEEGDFALVNTNDVENPDNAKIYVKVKNPDGTFSYSFLVDMSGAIGFTGKTPQFSMGTISTLEAGSSATATVSEDGVDSDGNPKYKINFAIPRGNPGAPFNPVGQYDTLELLQAAIPDGSDVNGMIAVGTEAPYEYYAWLNGGWVNQGKIAGGGDGRMIIIPNDVIVLTEQSSSAEIMNAFGSKGVFTDIVGSVENGAIAAINTPNGNIILPQIKAKANVYEDGEPKFDLTNFEIGFDGPTTGVLTEYTNKKIHIENAYDAILSIKNVSSLQANGTIGLYVVGGYANEDGTYIWDGSITAYYDETYENDIKIVEDTYLNSENEFSWDLNIPMYKNGAPLNKIVFSNHGEGFYAIITSAKGISNHSLSFTYLDPTSLNEGKEYSFYLENDVITLSKAGTGFGFVDVANILYKNNTTEYTPTGDYQPATKKYVDDNIIYKKIDFSGGNYDTRGVILLWKKSIYDTSYYRYKGIINGNFTTTKQQVYTPDGMVNIYLNASVNYFNEDGIENYQNDIYAKCNIGIYSLKLITCTYNSEDYVALLVGINGFFDTFVGYFSENTLFKWIDVNGLYDGYIYNKEIYDSIKDLDTVHIISTDDKLKTMFADITADMYQNINNISGYGISSIQNDADATTERNYPIKESGTLFYGKGPYGSVNGIFGSYLSNRWFARGGGRGSSQMTSWREFAFKDDIDSVYVGSGSIDNLTAAGEYVISPDVTNDPFTDYCWLKVMGLSDIVQILIRYQTLEIAIRSKINGNWSSWKLITPVDM